MRKIIFFLAFVGMLYLAINTYACYRRVFSSNEKTGFATYETTAPAGAGGASSERRSIAAGGKERAAEAVTHGWRWTSENIFPLVAPYVPTLCAPGLFILRWLSLEANNPVTWSFTILLSWWMWATAMRLAIVPAARACGIGYSPRAFRWYVRLLPPWRIAYGIFRPFLKWWRSLSYGTRDTDRWASFTETLYHVWRPGKILLGRASLFHLPLYQPVGIKGERHLAMIASPGAGKTAMLTTMLALHLGNIFCVDCGAEVINAIGRRLAAIGKRIVNFDPYAMAPGFPAASWNPIHELDEAVKRFGEPAAIEWATTLAESLVKTPTSGAGQNEWVYTQAKEFLTSLILYVYQYAPPDQRNIVYLRKLLVLGEHERAREKDDPFDVLIALMSMAEEFDGKIAAGANLLKPTQGKGDSRHAVLSCCIEQTAFLDQPRIAALSKENDFSCFDLITGKVAVFVVLPLTDMQSKLSGWVRALTIMSLYAAQRSIDKRPRFETLYACDEFGSMGYHPIFVTMAAVGRKFGIRLLTICQTIGQLKAVYPKSWGDFIGTSEATIWLSNGDQETREYLSTLLGKRTQDVKVSRGILSSLRPHVRRDDRAILSPGQGRDFLSNNVVVTRASDRPMKLKAEPFYKALPVSWIEAHRHYRETWPRALTRRILRLLTGRQARLSTSAASPINQRKGAHL